MNRITRAVLLTALVVAIIHGGCGKPFIPFNFWWSSSRPSALASPATSGLVVPPPVFYAGNGIPVVIGPPLYINTETKFNVDKNGKQNSTSSENTNDSSDSTTKGPAIKGYNITTNFQTKVVPVHHTT